MPKKEKQRVDARFLKEAIEAYEKAEKSGELRLLLSRSVMGKRATPPKKQQKN